MLQVPNRLVLFSILTQFRFWTVHQLLECFSVILGCIMEVVLLTFAVNTSAVVGAFLHNKLVSILNYCPFIFCSCSSVGTSNLQLLSFQLFSLHDSQSLFHLFQCCVDFILIMYHSISCKYKLLWQYF
jgi:hypothetical protein